MWLLCFILSSLEWGSTFCGLWWKRLHSVATWVKDREKQGIPTSPSGTRLSDLPSSQQALPPKGSTASQKYHQLGLSLYPVAFCGCLRPITQRWSWEGGGRRDSSHKNEIQLLWEETRRNQKLLFRAEYRTEMFLTLMSSLIRLLFGIKHPKVIRL